MIAALSGTILRVPYLPKPICCKREYKEGIFPFNTNIYQWDSYISDRNGLGDATFFSTDSLYTQLDTLCTFANEYSSAFSYLSFVT